MAVTLSHYRFGIEELLEATHGWHAAEDTNPAQGVIANDTTFLLRFTLQCDATPQSNIDAEFQYRKNGGAWTQITTSTSDVKAVASVAFTNGQNTTKRLSGTGTFESSSAGCTEDGISGGTAFDIIANGNGETECALQIVGADVALNDLLEFRLTRDGGTLLDTYSVVPAITVLKATNLSRDAGIAQIVLTAATAVVVAGAISLSAGTNRVVVTAPTATRTASISLRPYATSATDDFNRADGALGANWTQILSGASTSDLVIVSNAVQGASAATAAAAYYNAVTPANDQWAECAVNSAFFGGPIVRSTGTVAGANWNNYEAYNNTTTNIRIARHVNNTATTLANFPAPWNGVASVVTGDVIRLEAIGTSLRVFLNSRYIGQVTDASHASGSVGLITHNGTIASFDNFQAGDFRAPAIIVTAPTATLSAGAGGSSLAAGANVIVVTAPSATRTAGAVSLQAGTTPLVLTAPTAVRTATSALASGVNVVVVTAPTAARTAGTVSLSAGSQPITITAPTATRTAGSVSLAGGSQIVVITAPVATRSTTGGPTANLPAGANVVVLTAPPATRTAGASTLAAGAQPIIVTAPTAVRTATIARVAGSNSVIVTAPTATRTATRSAAAGSNVVVVTAPTATRSAGTVSLTAGSQVIVITAPLATRSTTSGPASNLAAGANVVVVTAPTATRTAGVSAPAAGRNSIVLTAPAPTVSVSTRSLTAGANVIVITAPTAALRQSQSVQAGQNVVVVTAPLATRTVTARALPAGAQPITVTAPLAVRTTAISRTAGSNSITITAPTATRSLTTMLQAGQQVVVLTAPVATRTVTARSLAAGANVVVITAPLAARQVTTALAAGTAQIVLTAPSATLTVGAVAVSVESQMIAMSAPAATITGGAELPDNIIVATIVDAGPWRTITTSQPDRTLVSENSWRTIDFVG